MEECWKAGNTAPNREDGGSCDMLEFNRRMETTINKATTEETEDTEEEKIRMCNPKAVVIKG